MKNLSPTKYFGSILIALFLSVAFASAQTPPAAVPKGEVQHYVFDRSRIFPGTTQDYWVYVPRQYDPARPACVYVGQDGVQFNAPAVFDRLIASGEMPITIGVFVMHGRVRALAPGALDRFNRSYEYDGLGANYARFILDEILPEVEKKTTADGRPIHLSHSGNDRCIGGSSSGAIAAFTAAWERPDAFSRVFSAIGTYVGLRGGNNYPTLIRKCEPKPIRVFLQDGSSDLNIYGGDWWMANQEMERALTFAGYQVNHVWGTSGHNGRQATEVFPGAMRWLWKDWPAPVTAGAGSPQLQEILIPGQAWKPVGGTYAGASDPAADAAGEIFFNADNKTYKIGADGAVSAAAPGARVASGQAFGPDGRRYVCAGSEIMAYDATGHARAIARGIRGRDLVAAHNGDIYVTAPGLTADSSRIWLILPRGKKRFLDTGIKFARGITLSPDQSLLYVADARSHWVYSFQVQPDGTLAYGQQYYHLHVPDTADDSGAAGLCVDREGRLYAATRMGVQVSDQAGRVNCIIPVPSGEVTGLAFGGVNSDTLFATCGGRVYSRRVRVTGAHAFAAPNKPAPPRL
ncbi:MAG TPA: SMP-30/gluconolactonase/LRE family protein [Armatimonadota bacterium]|nr:SMP-30/gluconolactonase/LRE family protein [Armatimonadota bacterium]